MPILEFQDFRPDQFEENDEPAQALNANPDATGFTPFLTPADIDPAWSGVPEGTIMDVNIGIASDRTIYRFLETTSKIYHITSSGLVDFSRPGGYAATHAWRTEQCADDVVAVNGFDPLQVYDFGAVSFVDVPGLPDQLTARHMCIARNFLFLANTTDNLYGHVPYRIRWSGLGRLRDFVPSKETQSDWQDIPGLGENRGVTGGDYLTVLMERGVVRGDYVGPPAFWNFDEIAKGAGDGCAYSNGYIKAHEATFYYSPQGFRMFDGTQLKNIGLGKVNNWFKRNHLRTSAAVAKMRMGHMPNQDIVLWGFVSTQSLDGQIDKLLVYNYETDRFALILVTGIKTIGLTTTRGATTLEELDALYPGGLETVPGSLDDEYWSGDPREVVGLWATKLQAFFGAPMTATLDTMEGEFNEGRRSVTDAFEMLVRDGSAQVYVGVRTRFQPTTTTWVGPINVARNGMFFKRVEGRYHRIRAVISGDWTLARGVNAINPRPGSRV